MNGQIREVDYLTSIAGKFFCEGREGGKARTERFSLKKYGSSYNEEVRVVSDGITRTDRVIATRLTEKERKERSNAPVWVYILFRLLLPFRASKGRRCFDGKS